MGFFNNEKQGAVNNMNMAQSQMVMSPIAQADQSYYKAKEEVMGAYLALGKEYFEANKNNESSDFAEQIVNIKEKQDKEMLWYQYRLSLEEKTLCEHCGAIITSDSAFCNKCGGKIEPRDFSALGVASKQEPAPVQQNICPSCGSPLVEGAAFCEKCGMKL